MAETSETAKMTSITQDELDAAVALIKKTFLSYDATNILLTADQMAYQGFEPLMFLAHLHRLGKAAKLSNDEHSNRILTLAIIVAVRGTTQTKLLKKSTPEMVAFLKESEDYYHIKWGTPTGATDVTMARIAAVHAAQLTTGIAKNLINFTPTLSMRPYSGMPKPMRTTVFASLIPQTLRANDLDLILEAYTVHQGKFHIFTLPPKKGERRLKTEKKPIAEYDQIRKFVDIQYNSSFYSSTVRGKVCSLAKIAVKVDPKDYTDEEIKAQQKHEEEMAQIPKDNAAAKYPFEVYTLVSAVRASLLAVKLDFKNVFGEDDPNSA